jgi:hypothetical protein
MEQAQSLDPHRPERCPETFGSASWPYVQRCLLDVDHDDTCVGSRSGLWCKECQAAVDSRQHAIHVLETGYTKDTMPRRGMEDVPIKNEVL